MTEIFAGASAKVREAGGTLAGGHTIRDPEPKYGLAVIGAAHPDHLLRKGGARPGRPAPPDEAARHRRAGVGCPPGPDKRGGPRDRDRRDAPPQPGGLARAGRRRRPVGHGRHRVRPARSRARDGPRLGRPVRLRRGVAAGAARRAGGGRGRGRDRRRRPQPTLRGRGAGRSGRTSGPSWSPSPTTRRRRAVSWRPSPRTASTTSRRRLDAAGVEHWWIGRVEAGEAGVSLA